MKITKYQLKFFLYKNFKNIKYNKFKTNKDYK